jgi:hypothetical protein
MKADLLPHLSRSAIWIAILSGVTEYHPSVSSSIGSSSYIEKRRVRWA